MKVTVTRNSSQIAANDRDLSAVLSPISEIKKSFKKENVQTQQGKKARKEKQEKFEDSLSEGNEWKAAFTDKIYMLNREKLIQLSETLGIADTSNDSRDEILKKIKDDIHKNNKKRSAE